MGWILARCLGMRLPTRGSRDHSADWVGNDQSEEDEVPPVRLPKGHDEIGAKPEELSMFDPVDTILAVHGCSGSWTALSPTGVANRIYATADVVLRVATDHPDAVPDARTESVAAQVFSRRVSWGVVCGTLAGCQRRLRRRPSVANIKRD